MNDVRARFGSALREWRVRQQMTQEQLAERSGLSYKFIGEIERGKGNPTLTTIASLAEALGANMTEIVAGAEPSRPIRADYRITKHDLQIVREAAASIETLVGHITSPRYRIKRRRKR